MFLVRLVLGMLLFASVMCFAFYIGTRQPVWKDRGVLILKWTMMALLGFFGVLILERLALFL